jgi:heme exporter protein C
MVVLSPTRLAGRPERAHLPARILDVLVALALTGAVWAIFVAAPAERVQGEVFRIFYVHVSLAWIAYGAFFAVFLASAAYLWRGTPAADRLARAAAEVGVLATTLVLATGSLWGRAVWGVWWTWDARLTTTLVLWFVYVGYLMVRSAILDATRAARVGAVLGILGFANVPLVQLSVTWWRTLHPAPSVTQPGALPPEMWRVLVVAVVAFTLLAVRLVHTRAALLRLEDDLRERVAAEGA